MQLTQPVFGGLDLAIQCPHRFFPEQIELEAHSIYRTP